MVMISANSFVTLYLGLELMSLSLYAMVAMQRDDERAVGGGDEVLRARARWRPGFLLYGMSMIYGATGSLDIDQRRRRRCSAGTGNRTLLLFGLVFVVSGDRVQARRRSVSHVGARRVPRRAHGRSRS